MHSICSVGKTCALAQYLARLAVIVYSAFILLACKTEPLSGTNQASVNSAKGISTEQQSLLLSKTKRAILDLDVAAVDKLTSQFDVNQLLSDHSSLLAWAVETQTPEIVTLLISKGATVKQSAGDSGSEINRFTPMIQACRYGNSQIIHTIIDHGGDPLDKIEDGTSAFHLCAGSASPEILSKMMKKGDAITAENAYGQTALMWAAYAANTNNFTFLVEHGARINHQTKEGYSPLFFAIKSQNIEIAKAAIKLGADVFANAKDGTTATQLAVYTNNFEFLQWFAQEMRELMSAQEIKAVLNAYDRNGYQLLHAAVKAHQPELVATLLDLGANPNQISAPSTLTWRYEANFKVEDYIPPQLTPIEIAEQNEFSDILNLLLAQSTQSQSALYKKEQPPLQR